MDLLTNLFSPFKVKTALNLNMRLSSPWRISVQNKRNVKFAIILKGRCTVRVEGEQKDIYLNQRDCILLPRGPRFEIFSQDDIEAISFHDLYAKSSHCCVAHGGGGDETLLSAGSFVFEDVQEPYIFRALPAVVHFSLDGNEFVQLEMTLSLLATEAGPKSMAKSDIVNRIAEIFSIKAVRSYLKSNPEVSSNWLNAVINTRIDKSLRLMNGALGKSWTLDLLAQQAYMSRASFVKQFKLIVGQSPIEYLKHKRLSEGCRLLCERQHNNRIIASMVGYASEEAFVRAFKKHVGMTPGAYRRIH